MQEDLHRQIQQQRKKVLDRYLDQRHPRKNYGANYDWLSKQAWYKTLIGENPTNPTNLKSPQMLNGKQLLSYLIK